MIECLSQPQHPQPQRLPKFYRFEGYEEEERGDDCGGYFPAKKKPRRGDTNEDGGSAGGDVTIVIPTLRRPSYVLKRKTLRAKFKKPKKSVRFAETTTTTTAAAVIEPRRVQQQQTTAATTAAATSDLWYRQSDIRRFKEKTMELASKNANARGTESLRRNRRRHRTAAIRFVLIAHKRGKTDAYVAELAAKLGRWNREIALGDAIADYYEAYHPSLLPLVPRPSPSSSPPTISLVSRGRVGRGGVRYRLPLARARSADTGKGSRSKNAMAIM